MAMCGVWRAVAALFCATLFAALTSCTSAHTNRLSAKGGGQVAPTAGAASNRIPGDDPSIQHWFLRVAKAQVAFDNALFQAEQGIAKQDSSMCKTINKRIAPLLSALPRLRNNPAPAGSAIADAIEPAMRTFNKMGYRCTNGDFAGAHVLMHTGVRQQADAQTTLDEILDGDANLGGGQ